ncbi:hypothetical protein, partial [Corallococcus terminator]
MTFLSRMQPSIVPVAPRRPPEPPTQGPANRPAQQPAIGRASDVFEAGGPGGPLAGGGIAGVVEAVHG